MGVVVKRAVRVKVIVSEQFKSQTASELQAMVAKLEGEINGLAPRIDALHKLKDAGPDQSRQLERLEVLLRKNERTKAAAEAELGRVSGLEIGSEYERGVLDGFVEVNVGDDISRLADCEIVVRDDKIVEIRDAR